MVMPAASDQILKAQALPNCRAAMKTPIICELTCNTNSIIVPLRLAIARTFFIFRIKAAHSGDADDFLCEKKMKKIMRIDRDCWE